MGNKVKIKGQSFFKEHNSEVAVLNLINRFFWKSKIGPICSLTLPILFMIIYRIISIDNSEGINIFISGFATYVSLSILPICLVSLPQMIVELKSSIILRKISVSRITSFKFCLIVLLYFLAACIISTLIILVIYAIILNKDAYLSFNNVQWGEFVYALINLYLISLTVGLFLGVIVRRSTISQIIGFVVLLLSVSLAGQFIPLSVISGSKPIQIVSLFSPITYSLSLLNNILLVRVDSLISEIHNLEQMLPNMNDLLTAMQNFNAGESIFDVNHTFCVFQFKPTATDINQLFNPIYQPWNKILNLFMSVPFAIFFYTYSIKRFNWTNR